jgi:hypothetical protein
MSKGERMRTHTERTESDHLSAQISPAKGETENSTHCVLNLEKTWFARFITQRVMNFYPRLQSKTLPLIPCDSAKNVLSLKKCGLHRGNESVQVAWLFHVFVVSIMSLR